MIWFYLFYIKGNLTWLFDFLFIYFTIFVYDEKNINICLNIVTVFYLVQDNDLWNKILYGFLEYIKGCDEWWMEFYKNLLNAPSVIYFIWHSWTLVSNVFNQLRNFIRLSSFSVSEVTYSQIVWTENFEIKHLFLLSEKHRIKKKTLNTCNND